MKTMLIELTRPRSSSGVASWMVVWRMATLIWSVAPVSPNISRETGNERATPNAMVARPNPATVTRSARPGALHRGQRHQDQGHQESADACAEVSRP